MEKLNRVHDDERLRTRFTSWLATVLRRAKIDYARQQERQVKTVPMEDVPEEQLTVEDMYAVQKLQFEFEEERLAEAFFFCKLKTTRLASGFQFAKKMWHSATSP